MSKPSDELYDALVDFLTRLMSAGESDGLRALVESDLSFCACSPTGA